MLFVLTVAWRRGRWPLLQSVDFSSFLTDDCGRRLRRNLLPAAFNVKLLLRKASIEG
jgi:hypothetical protein